MTKSFIHSNVSPMPLIIRFLTSIAYAKEKVLAVPLTENGEIVAAFKDFQEFRYSLYGAVALFVVREIWSFSKEKLNKTSERLDRMEKLLHRIEVIIEIRENERGKK